MITFLKKYTTPISILASLVVLWQFPTTINVIFVAILAVSLATAISSTFKKNREAYRQGKITRTIFVRNVLIEIIGILLAMTLAGLLGGYIAQIATEQVSDNLIKLIAGILIGLLVGMSIGILMKRTWKRLIKTPTGH